MTYESIWSPLQRFSYDREPKPSRAIIEGIASGFKTTSERVKIWFENKRYTDRVRPAEEEGVVISEEEDYGTVIRRRQNFTVEETSTLEHKFAFKSYPSKEEVNGLAFMFDTADKSITFRYQSRRVKEIRLSNQRNEKHALNFILN